MLRAVHYVPVVEAYWTTAAALRDGETARGLPYLLHDVGIMHSRHEWAPDIAHGTYRYTCAPLYTNYMYSQAPL